MKLLLHALTIALLLCISALPAYADRHSDAKAQVEFGMEVAKKGLWKEAVVHWKKAISIDPAYAAAWNDLGIAYEQLGQFAEAREAYEKAVTLDPGSSYIRSNYDLF